MADRNDFDRERYGIRGTEREHDRDRDRGDWPREGNVGDRERNFGGERGYGGGRSFGGYGGERSGRPYSGAGEWVNREPEWERGSNSGPGWRESGSSGRHDWGGESEHEGRFTGERGRTGTSTLGSSSRPGYSGGGYGGSSRMGGYQAGLYTGGMGTYGESGRYAGRGPKGYQRSDDRIREDVCEYLTHHPEIDASEVEVQVKNGEVTLTGTVDRREMKGVAEEAAENVSGVKDVHNQLKVQQQGASAGQGQSQGDRQQGRQGQASQQTQHKS